MSCRPSRVPLIKSVFNLLCKVSIVCVSDSLIPLSPPVLTDAQQISPLDNVRPHLHQAMISWCEGMASLFLQAPTRGTNGPLPMDMTVGGFTLNMPYSGRWLCPFSGCLSCKSFIDHHVFRYFSRYTSIFGPDNLHALGISLGYEF